MEFQALPLQTFSNSGSPEGTHVDAAKMDRLREICKRLTAGLNDRGAHGNYYRYYEAPKTLAEAQPYDKLLVLRQYGGFGDMLIISVLLNEIHKRYPDLQINFACRRIYDQIFQGVEWLHTVPYDVVHFDGKILKNGYVWSRVTEIFDIVEDITIPCHVWEEINFHPHYMKWRNRLDMWGNWLGLYDFRNPTSCIRISEEEKWAAKRKFAKSNKPLLVFAPTSANKRKVFYHAAELKQELETQYEVVMLGEDQGLEGCIKTDTLREYLSLVAAAETVVSVDTAAFHAAGILHKRCYGLFNTNDGDCYSQYYPLAIPIQLCEKKCIFRYCVEEGESCFKKESIQQILQTMRLWGSLI